MTSATEPRHEEVVPTQLLEVVGKALYGWSDDEPNEATGYTTVYESAKVAAAIHKAGYRLVEDEASTPLDAELLARAWELAGYGEVTGDIDEYQEWGGKPREIAEKVAVEYERLTRSREPAA